MSASEVAQCIKQYLRDHGGAAAAGDVTAHATAAGHAPSTIRRVADRVVSKLRDGNTFTWSLKPEPVFTASPAGDAEPLPSRVGRIVDRRAKQSLWDAMKLNGQSMRPDHESRYVDPQGAPAVSQERRQRLADVEESEAPPAWVSKYAHLSQRERLDLIAQRPTLRLDDFCELTEVEAIGVLEGDDDGLYTLPGISDRMPGARKPY